ncbi:MAG TPA: GatB/YqeY domain-containing protein [Clostridiales bacterium]|nr:GatB/YqeY domain-containing protein [Clostridiales bacterium]
MSLKERLMSDFKESMRQKDSLRKSVITMIRAAIKQAEIDNKKELNDQEIQEIISKQVKQRKEAMEDFIKGNREDLVEQTKAEIEILTGYLPRQLTEEEIFQVVKQVIDETGASSIKDMGKVMPAVMEKVKGQADGKTVNSIVKQLLS